VEAPRPFGDAMVEPVESVTWSAFQGGMALDCVRTTRRWRVVHSHYAVCVLHAGRSEWSYRQREFSFETGSIYLCEPGEVHATRRIHGPGDFSVVFLEPELVLAEATKLGMSAPPHFPPGKLSSRGLLERVVAVRRALARADGEGAAQESSLLLRELLDRCDSPPPRGRLPSDKVHRARQHLRDLMLSRPESVVRLQPIAEELGISYCALIHGFSRQFGVPPYEFLNQLRAQYVLADIVRGPADDCVTLSTLAHKWGYADGPHLSRVFRQYYGTSPKQMASSVNPRWLKRPTRRK
jgi:AraC-like DNA-binding protein